MSFFNLCFIIFEILRIFNFSKSQYLQNVWIKKIDKIFKFFNLHNVGIFLIYKISEFSKYLMFQNFADVKKFENSQKIISPFNSTRMYWRLLYNFQNIQNSKFS